MVEDDLRNQQVHRQKEEAYCCNPNTFIFLLPLVITSQTVGVCATLCQDRRAAITSSGILPTLAHLFLNNPTQSVNQLSLEGVEFLQCALLAGQYRYAARLVGGTWPRPDATVNVKQVLRYYYLRGMIHLGCNDFVMAHRCFWTCLSVPAEVCCKIAVEAWKKLVLVQCIMNDGNDPQSNGVDFPKCMPSCLLRMLWSSKEGTNNMSTTTPQNTPQELQLTSNPVLQVQPLIAQSQSSKQSPMNTESTACYMDLAAEFRRRNKSEVQSLIVKHKETYEEDGNFGLVQQCLTQLIHNQVRHISKMYSVVSLTKAASLLGISNTSDEATREQVATLLFQSGVPCEIQEDGMIVFYDSEDDSVALSSLVDLAEWMALIDRVQRLDVNILTSPRYQNLIRKEVSTGTASSGEAKAATAMSSGSRGVDNL